MMCLLLLGVGATSVYAQQQQRKDTLVVARDGTGEYRNIQEAVEAVRAFRLQNLRHPYRQAEYALRNLYRHSQLGAYPASECQ